MTRNAGDAQRIHDIIETWKAEHPDEVPEQVRPWTKAELGLEDAESPPSS